MLDSRVILLRDKPNLIITCVDKGQFRADMAKLGRLVGGDRALYLDAGKDSHSGQVIIGHWCGSMAAVGMAWGVKPSLSRLRI
jgi:hypothetical protein